MASTTLVPPRRLGALLRRARQAAGLELTDLVAESTLSLVELEDVEQGRRRLDSTQLEALLDLYGVEPTGLLPERARLVIDLDEGRISVDQTGVDVAEERGPDAILARYLALVYRLRGLDIGTPIPLRDVDVELLATALVLDGSEVERRLQRLIEEESTVADAQRRIRRQFLVPLAGVVIGATAAGTVILVAEDDAPGAPDAVTTVVDEGLPRLADAAIVESPGGTATGLGPGGTVEGDPGPAVATDLGVGGAVERNPDGDD